MWSSEAWIWMDFEIPGIHAVKESWELGILGLMVETKTELKYYCVILDDKLENISNIYPEHCIFNPELDIDLIIQHLSELEGFSDCKYAFCWSSVDIEFLDHYFGHYWDGLSYTDTASSVHENHAVSFFGETEIQCVNALPDCRRLGRNLHKMRGPHTLKRYMDLLGIEHPSGGKASNIIRELNKNWRDPKCQISERDRMLTHELLQYNYYDCFGLRKVMSRLNQEAEEGTFFPNPDFHPHPDFSLD
tara:strand:- start:76 stop:816 length:741 start_codon:yes stop_codon:yes gene_type:complete